MAESSQYERKRQNARNKRIRAENDHNRVLNEYVMLKYGPISEEFNKFYDILREKYPEKHSYKGSQKFRVWVRDEIKKYNTEEQNTDNVPEAVACSENTIAVPEAVVNDMSEVVVNDMPEVVTRTENTIAVPTVAVPEAVVNLPELVDISIGENVVIPAPVPALQNVIANGLPQELEELDALIGNIIANIENQCDEGIALSPNHELEVDPLYYEGEIEGLDDIDIDMPVNLLEAELENF